MIYIFYSRSVRWLETYWCRFFIAATHYLRISQLRLVFIALSPLIVWGSGSWSLTLSISCPVFRRWCPSDIYNRYRSWRTIGLLVWSRNQRKGSKGSLINVYIRTSYIVTCVFTFITAAVIAEACSASPSAGSIYLWAAEAGGKRFGRLFGFIVAWWSTTAWTTFCASKSLGCYFFVHIWINWFIMIGNTQSAVNYMLSVRIVLLYLPVLALNWLSLGTGCFQCRLSHWCFKYQVPCCSVDMHRSPPGFSRINEPRIW